MAGADIQIPSIAPGAAEWSHSGRRHRNPPLPPQLALAAPTTAGIQC